jgi:hypothetical protein
MSQPEIKPAHQCQSDDRFELVTERSTAEALLRGYRGDAVAMHRLRELLATTDQNVFRYDDHVALAVAATKIVKGELRVRKDPCERKDERNRRYLDWIMKYRHDTVDVAADLRTTIQNILGLAAFESDFGRSRFATHGNNLFGLSTSKDKPLPGQIGIMLNQANPDQGMSMFPDYLTSANAFAQTKGQLIKGETEPAKFASILQNRGQFGLVFNRPLATYVEDLTKVIHEIAIRLHCS